MPYSEMLFEILREKNLTDREVIDKCRENGTDLSESYFNRIKNNRKNPPSEEISKSIAKVCEVDERRLIIEGYVDKAPKIIREVFSCINFMTKSATMKMAELIKRGEIKKVQEYLENGPVSDTLIEILDSKEKYIEYLETNFTFESLGNGLAMSMTLKEPVGFEVKDNAMEPKINKGDKVIIEDIKNNFIGNEILLIKTKKNPELRVRNVIKINDSRQIQGYNSDYEIETCDKEDITIIGKVTGVIKKIE